MFTPQILRPVTSADVAREAGVSRTTVSFVLNDRPNARISPQTRKRVLDTAMRLGYTPNVRARALRTGESREIIIPISTIELGVDLAPMLMRLMDKAADQGLEAQVLLSRAGGGAGGATEWALRRPRGVIALAKDCDEEATAVLRKAGVQGLIVIGFEPITYAPCVVLDQRELAVAALSYLAGRGHHTIASIYPSTPTTEVTARSRALRQEAAASGITLTEVRGGYDPSTLRDWAGAWRYAAQPPTAVVCHDDPLAFAAIHALHDAGVDVPGDVAVVGQGNHRVAASFVPGLTTVWRNLRQLDAQLVDAMVAMFDGEHITELQAPPVEIIERASA